MARFPAHCLGLCKRPSHPISCIRRALFHLQPMPLCTCRISFPPSHETMRKAPLLHQRSNPSYEQTRFQSRSLPAPGLLIPLKT